MVIRSLRGYYYDPAASWVPSFETFVVGGGTWADGHAFEDNNHGRLFPSLKTISTRGVSVFATIGAFSKERFVTSLAGIQHQYYLGGFNTARDALNRQRTQPDDWSSPGTVGIDGGVYHDDKYSTDNHDGARVFVARRVVPPESGNPPPVVGVCDRLTNIQLVPAPYGDPDKAQATFEFTVSAAGDAALEFSSYASGPGGWVFTDWWRGRLSELRRPGQTTLLTPYIDKSWRTPWRLTFKCDGRQLAQREGPAGT